MQPPYVQLKPRGEIEKLVLVAQAARLTPGLTIDLTVLAYPKSFVTKRRIRQNNTSVKTRPQRCCCKQEKEIQ